MSAVLLINPKYPHNVGQVIRACAAYGVYTLRFTGDRMQQRLEELKRVPREERMRGYSKVKWSHSERPFDEFPDLTPVCVEVRNNSERLPDFVHPEKALYVFGPEDGGLARVISKQCHRFVTIPTDHCINLSMAVGTILYDRRSKQKEYSYDATYRMFTGDYLDE